MRIQRFFSILTLLLASAIIPTTSIAQTAGGPVKFSRGMIIKKDGTRFRANNLLFDAQTLTYKDPKTQQVGQLPLSDVEYVRAKTGTHALVGGLIGGGLFFLSGLAAVAEAESDPTVEVENTGQALLIVTAVGFGGGLLIGAAFPKEKTVFQYNKLTMQRSRPPDFGFIGVNREITFVSWRFSL